jgi:hypothetical protein
MTRLLLIFAAAVLLLAGCSGEGPLSSGGAGKAVDAAKLTVSGDRTGGTSEPGSHHPRFSSGAPTRLEQLHFDETLTSYGLELTWLEVQDSRCPKGVVCFWEGEVKVLLGAREVEGKDLGTFWLALRFPEDERAVAKIGNRLIQLTEVGPYPVAAVETPRAEYVASLAVSLDLVVRPPETEATTSDSRAGAGGEAKSDPDGNPADPDYAALAAELSTYRAQWKGNGFDSYQFRFQRSCFCTADFRREVLVRVNGGDIQAAEYVDSGEPVDPENYGRYPTVAALFDLIEGAIEGKAARIEAVYNKEFGYPTRVYIDRSLSMADEEQQLEAAELRPLR